MVDLVVAAAEMERIVRCHHVWSSQNNPNSIFGITHDAILFQRSSLHGVLQQVVKFAFISIFIYQAHYLVYVGHSGGTRMYKKIKKEYYSRSMVNEIFQTAKVYRSCSNV